MQKVYHTDPGDDGIPRKTIFSGTNSQPYPIRVTPNRDHQVTYGTERKKKETGINVEREG
jgi:hypothetical protein